MAEAQARAEEKPFEFHVPMDMETDGPNPEAEETASDAATDAGESTEQAEAEHIERVEPEEGDTSETLRKKYNAQYSRKLEADRKRMREELLAELKAQQPVETPKEETPQAAPEESGDPVDAVYKIDFDKWSPKFREGSDLAEYGDELKEVINQALQYALEGVRTNDRALRQQMQEQERVGKARTVIAEWAKEIQDHPDFEDIRGDLSKFAEKTRSLAVDDPELWVETVEKKFGLDRNWRGAKQAEQQQTAAQDKRLASKPAAVGQRPTRATLVPSSNGNMAWDDALTATIRKMRR